ncbi:MAG: hypothetical protein DCF12_05235 [Snowella sp.]|nr:MAG: hypothetical protein DCF12_05235 [Snowella sp.]
MTNNPYIGSSFDDFLAEEGILEDCTQFATDKVSEWQESNKNKVLQNSDCEREGDKSKSMAIGEILWFGGHKDGQKNNYGFIFYTEIDKNKIYVDRNQVPQHLQELFEGDREKGKGIVVEFEIGNNHRGPCAVNVRLHQRNGIFVRQRSSLRLEIYKKAYIECEDKSQVYVEDHRWINNGDIVSFAIKNNRRQSAIEVVKIDPNTIDKKTIKDFVYSSNFNLSKPFIESYVSTLSEAEAIHFILEKIKFVSNNDEALELLKKVSENLFFISRELRDVLFNFNFQEYVDFIKKNLDYEDESIRQILWTEFLEYLNSPDYKIFEPFLWLYISKVEIQHSVALVCNKIRSIPLDQLDSFIERLLSLSKGLFLCSEDLRNLLKERNINQYAGLIQEILNFHNEVEDLRIFRQKAWTELFETISNSNCSNEDRDTLWKKITYLEIGLEYHNYLWNFAPISSKKKIIEARYSVFFSLVNEFKDSGYVGVDGISMNYRDLYQFNINDKTLASLWAGSNASESVRAKMLSARGAEKLVRKFYENLGNNVEDIAIHQVTKKSELWKQADIRVSSNKSQKLLDVKNTRQAFKSKVYSDVCVRKFKEIQGEDVIIAAVLSPNLQLKYMDGSNTPDFYVDPPISIYLGELSYKRLQSLAGIFSDKGIELDMTRGFEPESYLPPWLFDYDEQFYQNQISISDKLKTLQDSEIPSYDDFKILNEGSIEAYIPLFIFANKPIPETWRQQIPQWKITLIELLYRQDNSCLTLSHIYMSILKHFLIMLYNENTNYDPTNIMNLLDGKTDSSNMINLLGNNTHPLKIYDPLGIIRKAIIQNFCKTLATLWNARKEVNLNGFNIFKFSGRGLLEGKRKGETSYIKLLAYCGGKIKEDEKCRYSPLIIKKGNTCPECHYLICPKCGYCRVDDYGNSNCSEYKRRKKS